VDPITGMILGAMALSGLIVSGARAGSDALTASRASKAGAWDFLDRNADRREARRQRRSDAWRKLRERRHRQAGGDGNFRPGAKAYLGDVYHGWWEDKLAKREARRQVRPQPVYVFDPESGKVRRDGPVGPSLRDKADAVLDKADAAIKQRVTQFRESRLARRVADHPLVRPVGERPQPAPAEVEPPVEVSAPDPWASSVPVADPAASVRPADPVDPVDPVDAGPDVEPLSAVADRALEAWNRGDWAAAAAGWQELRERSPAAYDRFRLAGRGETGGPVDRPIADWHVEASRRAREGSDEANVPDPTTDPTTDGGTTMTAPTGEVANYEMHKAELGATRQGFQTQLDLASATLAALASAKAAVSAQAEHARALQAASQNKADGVAAANLDGETQGHAAMQVDAVDANRLDAQFEALEQAEVDAQAFASAAEAGLASVDAEEATIDAKYGDAASTVAAELGGDSSYLQSGGGGANVGAVAADGESVSVSGRAIGGQGGGRHGGGSSGAPHSNIGVIGAGATMAGSAVGDGATVVHGR
jgi:hypothetical protein